MPTTDTTGQGVQLPLNTDPPAVPDDLAIVWYGAIGRGIPRFATQVQRDALLVSPVDGMFCWVDADKCAYVRSGGQWRVDWMQPISWTAMPALNSDTASNFVPYSTGVQPVYKRTSTGRVTITGAIKPGDSATASALPGAAPKAWAAGAIPAAIRPTFGSGITPVWRCVASGSDSWGLQIQSDFSINAGRYSGSPSTSTWMPFHISYDLDW